VDAKLAVHHGIGASTDLRGAHRVTETGCGSSREVDQVLSAGGFGAWNYLRFTDAVECSLAAELAGRFDRPHNGGEIAVGAQMVAFDDGRIAPIRAGKPYLATAGRLNKCGGDREAFFRGRAETGGRLRCRDRKLLQHKVDIGRMTVDAARQVDFGLDRVDVHGTVRHLSLVLVDDARQEGMILQVLSDAPQIGDRLDSKLSQLRGVTDTGKLEKAMAGIDCVVHLAGMSVEAAWEHVLPLNIEGCYNVFEAARRSGVKRMVFASSNHAIGFHRRERFIDNNVVPRPDTRYGVSKVFGEALGRLYADKYGLSVACLRIGSFLTPDRPTETRHLLTWISHRDRVQLVRRCIDYPNYHFVIIYGVSNNLRNRWDNSNVKFLGYRPEDDSEVFAAEILALGKKENEIAAQFHGGFYTPMEFSGDTHADRLSAKRNCLDRREARPRARIDQLWRCRFSLYLRRSFAKSMGYSAEMLSRPVVGIAQSASGFNNCHRHVRELVEAVKRGEVL
jgi:uronate dehydrogenase